MRERVQCIIVKDKRILFVNDFAADHYYSPGGKIENGESHEDTIIRELEEEIGVEVKKIEFHSSYEIVNVILNVQQVEHTYFVKIEGEPKPLSEIRDVVWVSWEEIVDKKFKMPEELHKNVLVNLKASGIL